ncbi:beta-lactam resistance family protein [Shigella sonnei]|nr:beta-lactam resistance family protein [Shigella sonnei]SRW50339.1 beta-lactam resistance family protein [Shigella sonnei]
MLSNIYPLKLMDQSREMWAVMNRLIELTNLLSCSMLLVIVRDSKARYSFQSSFSSLNICHQRILIIVITQAFTFGEILSSLYPFGINYFMDLL